MACAVRVSVAQPISGPTVQEVVEFTRIIQPLNQDDDALREQVSPDGTRAFIVTRKADVVRDVNHYELQLLDIRPGELAARTEFTPTTIFSTDVGEDDTSTDAAVKLVQWVDDRTLVFLGRLSGSSEQVYSVDVLTRQVTKLTNESNLIISFAASKGLRRIVYAVTVPNPPQRAGRHDVVVGNQTFWSVKFGQDNLQAQQRKYQFFAIDVAAGRPARALGEPFPESNGAPPIADVSPNGRWALLPRYEPDRLEAWQRQYASVAERAARAAPALEMDPLHYFLKGSNYVPRRMTAWDLDAGKERTIVDAPDDAMADAEQLLPNRLWQGSGTSVVLTGTQLPIGTDGKTPPASHVIEYWPDSGRWVDVATLQKASEGARATEDGFWVNDGDKRRYFQRLPTGGWRESATDRIGSAFKASTWMLRILQDANRPADVYAVEPVGGMKRLTRLNPQFDPGTWGTMQPFAWHDAKGQQWNGGLMTGAGMDAHTAYPLVIQTYGFAADRFYLDGPNPWDGATSAFAGRAFLRHGILVLAFPYRAAADPSRQQTHQSFQGFDDGVRSAIEALVKQGRVDPSRVGIIGWSATGERVLNLLTFGDVPIRAATMADSDAGTLFSYTITYGFLDTTWARKERTNEGLPFGNTLAAWVRNDPSLHTDCVKAALRIESYGRNVGNNWDLQALLRRQYKPVEMIVVPTGAHSLGGPGDRMTSLQGNVDWFSFWLTGRVRTEPVAAWETKESLGEQYANWQQMEKLKIIDDARPRCVR